MHSLYLDGLLVVHWSVLWWVFGMSANVGDPSMVMVFSADSFMLVLLPVQVVLLLLLKKPSKAFQSLLKKGHFSLSLSIITTTTFVNPPPPPCQDNNTNTNTTHTTPTTTTISKRKFS